jgi:hypothetical protein
MINLGGKMNKRYLSISFMLVVFLVGLAVPSFADAPILPGGPFVPPDKDANRSAIMTFEEVEAELFKLEKRSKGLMELEVVGYSEEGRPLYIAMLGWGPAKMWIQGRIHGNEPLGNDVCLEVIKRLLSGDKWILEKMSFWIIPYYNPDGGELFQRGNVNGVDLNRNWWRTDGNDYSESESQAFYWAWAEFKPTYAIDLHHQGTYFVEDEEGEDTNEMTTFSIGIPVWEQDLEPWVWNYNRMMAVVAYDAVDKLGFCNPTKYPRINIHTAVVSSMMLGNPGPGGHDAEWKTAAMFFENRGGIGNKSRGYIVKQMVVGVHAIIDAIAYDQLFDVDPDRWDEIPERGSRIRTSDKWPDDWAE